MNKVKQLEAFGLLKEIDYAQKATELLLLINQILAKLYSTGDLDKIQRAQGYAAELKAIAVKYDMQNFKALHDADKWLAVNALEELSLKILFYPEDVAHGLPH